MAHACSLRSLCSPAVVIWRLSQVLLDELQLSAIRLDGSTPVPERQSLIDSFNNSDRFFGALLFFYAASGEGRQVEQGGPLAS